MRKSISILLVVLICGLSLIPINIYKLNASAYYDEGFTSAKAMCVLEKDSKRVILSKNMDERLPMASTTKIMTAITVIQYCNDLEKTVVVSDKAVGVEGSSIYLKKDEVMSIKDLLYGLMLRSGNDSATALAYAVGGDINGFAGLMNKLAKEIGAVNTNFTNPHGLHDDNHYTTAYDLSLITAYALNNPIFKEIVSSKKHIVNATNKTEVRYMTNKNKLLFSLEGCCGVKTGFTKKAGRCLVSACDRDNTTYVCTVLNCGPMFEDSARLLNDSFNSYKNVKIIDKYKEIYNEYFIDEYLGKLYLYTDEDFIYPLKENEKNNIRIEYYLTLEDAEVNDEVGEIRIFFDKHLIKILKLYTMNKIDKLIDSNTLKISEILWEERINEN